MPTAEEKMMKRMNEIENNLRTCMGNECKLLANELAVHKAELAEMKKRMSSPPPDFGKEKEDIKKCVGDECAVIRGEVQALGEGLLTQIDERFSRREQEEASRRAAILRRREMELAEKRRIEMQKRIAPTPAPAPAPAPVQAPAVEKEEETEDNNIVTCQTCEMPISLDGVNVGDVFKCPHCNEEYTRKE